MAPNDSSPSRCSSAPRKCSPAHEIQALLGFLAWARFFPGAPTTPLAPSTISPPLGRHRHLPLRVVSGELHDGHHRRGERRSMGLDPRGLRSRGRHQSLGYIAKVRQRSAQTQQAHDYWWSCAWRLAIGMRPASTFADMADEIGPPTHGGTPRGAHGDPWAANGTIVGRTSRRPSPASRRPNARAGYPTLTPSAFAYHTGGRRDRI